LVESSERCCVTLTKDKQQKGSRHTVAETFIDLEVASSINTAVPWITDHRVSWITVSHLGGNSHRNKKLNRHGLG
jgi:hypothetical protein